MHKAAMTPNRSSRSLPNEVWVAGSKPLRQDAAYREKRCTAITERCCDDAASAWQYGLAPAGRPSEYASGDTGWHRSFHLLSQAAEDQSDWSPWNLAHRPRPRHALQVYGRSCPSKAGES